MIDLAAWRRRSKRQRTRRAQEAEARSVAARMKGWPTLRVDRRTKWSIYEWLESQGLVFSEDYYSQPVGLGAEAYLIWVRPGPEAMYVKLAWGGE